MLGWFSFIIWFVGEEALNLFLEIWIQSRGHRSLWLAFSFRYQLTEPDVFESLSVGWVFSPFVWSLQSTPLLSSAPHQFTLMFLLTSLLGSNKYLFSDYSSEWLSHFECYLDYPWCLWRCRVSHSILTETVALLLSKEYLLQLSPSLQSLHPCWMGLSISTWWYPRCHE